MNVVVVGAGKMGLPLACQLASRGASVVACDTNASAVARINAGECHIDEPGVPELLAEVVAAGALTASTDTLAAAARADVVVVIVPALLTDASDVDTSILESVAAQLARSIRPGTLVSFETTMPVGGTRSRLLPALESGGLRGGVDFDLVFSPERVKSRFVLRNLTVNRKVVGGLTPQAATRGEEFYRSYLGAPVQNVGTLEAAEMVKLAGMVYRDVTIALSNELAGYAAEVGVDLASLLEAINTDGEAALLSPGIGVGGHCTPVYPYFLIRDAERRGLSMTLADRARRVNDAQAARGIDRLESAVGPLAGLRVTLLGLAFRPQVKEHICSPTFLLHDELVRRGAEVRVADPLYDEAEIAAHGLTSADHTDPADAVVLVTAHPEFLALDWAAAADRGLRAVLDGRDVLDPAAVEAAGVRYLGIGSGHASSGPRAAEPDGPTVPVAVPLLGHDEAEAVADVVRSGWVMQGPEVAAFEAEFAATIGASRACAVSSGTAALHLALLALGIGPGDEVVTVSHTFVATANAIRLVGAVPVFVDIDPATFNLDARAIERAVTPRTAAVVAVHQYGMPCDLDAVLQVARRHCLKVVEDAACAIGSEVAVAGRWARVGAPHGDVATFSFHPRKVVTTGEGGMVVAASAELDRRVRRLRQHGSLDSVDYPVVGLNYRMSDLHAALGRRQLGRLEAMVAERRGLAAELGRRLAGSGLLLPTEPGYARSNWQSYCVRLPDALDRDLFLKLLADQRVSARPGCPSIHELDAYRDVEVPHALPATELAAHSSVCLPLWPGMTSQHVDRVVHAVESTLRIAVGGEEG